MYTFIFLCHLQYNNSNILVVTDVFPSQGNSDNCQTSSLTCVFSHTLPRLQSYWVCFLSLYCMLFVMYILGHVTTGACIGQGYILSCNKINR